MRSLEDRVKEIEAELKSLLAKEKCLPFSRDWWINKAMLYLMANQKLRTQTFRFIEAFPELRTLRSVYEHILEDFAPTKAQLPILFKDAYLLIKTLGPNCFSAWVTEQTVKTIARHFIVSRDAKTISRTLSKLQRQGAGYSLALLGEEVFSEQEAEQYKNGYEKLIRQLNLMTPEVNVSLKLSSLYSHFHPLAREDAKRIVKERLSDILRYCWSHGGKITIDMEQYQLRDLTLEIFKELVSGEFARWKWGLSVAHQAYLRDAKQVLLELCHFAQGNTLFLGVRLVKGAYWDYEIINAQQNNWLVPVYTERQQTDENFEKCVNIALGYYPWIRTAVGTHNLRSLAYAMAKREELGLPKEALEVQVLYGLGNQLVKPIIKMGYPVKVYIGVGDLVAGMSFFVRRLLENTSQTSSAFFAQQGGRVWVKNSETNP